MTIVLALVTLISAALSLILLWPYGALVAIAVTPLVASASVLLCALAIVIIQPRAANASPHPLIAALCRLLPR